MLPANRTGLCVLATLLQDIDILPGNKPVPISIMDYLIPRSKRAVPFIPLLVVLGVVGGCPLTPLAWRPILNCNRKLLMMYRVFTDPSRSYKISLTLAEVVP